MNPKLRSKRRLAKLLSAGWNTFGYDSWMLITVPYSTVLFLRFGWSSPALCLASMVIGHLVGIIWTNIPVIIERQAVSRIALDEIAKCADASVVEFPVAAFLPRGDDGANAADRIFNRPEPWWRRPLGSAALMRAGNRMVASQVRCIVVQPGPSKQRLDTPFVLNSAFGSLVFLSDTPDQLAKRPHPLSSFHVLHEVGHATQAGVLRTALVTVRSVPLLVLAAWGAIHLPFEVSSALIVGLLVLLFVATGAGFWSPIVRSSILHDEMVADIVALRSMEPDDIEALIKFLDGGVAFRDNRLDDADNEARMFFLKQNASHIASKVRDSFFLPDDDMVQPRILMGGAVAASIGMGLASSTLSFVTLGAELALLLVSAFFFVAVHSALAAREAAFRQRVPKAAPRTTSGGTGADRH